MSKEIKKRLHKCCEHCGDFGHAPHTDMDCHQPKEAEKEYHGWETEFRLWWEDSQKLYPKPISLDEVVWLIKTQLLPKEFQAEKDRIRGEIEKLDWYHRSDSVNEINQVLDKIKKIVS